MFIHILKNAAKMLLRNSLENGSFFFMNTEKLVSNQLKDFFISKSFAMHFTCLKYKTVRYIIYHLHEPFASSLYHNM